MRDLTTPNVQLESGVVSFLPGYVFGRRQPSLLVRVRAHIREPAGAVALPTPSSLLALSNAWSQVTGGTLNMSVLVGCVDSWPDFAKQLALMTTDLLRAAHLCVVDQPHVLNAMPVELSPDWTKLLLAVAPGREQATQLAWIAVLKVVQRLWLDESDESVLISLQEVLKTLKQFAPKSSNTPRFLAAAYENNVPVLQIGHEIFQYGYGRPAQWFDSTFTLRTSNIAARLARDKEITSTRLRQAGLPVPAQQAVLNIDMAIKAANKMGYPVVIKPADLDGGRGVSIGLSCDEQVRHAFERAQVLSRRVLIEKHVIGRDFRLTVMDSRLLWAVERQPAGVTGNGLETVQALVEKENRSPQRGEGAHATLKYLQIDDEAHKLLEQQGLVLTDVPDVGRFVALRRIPNVGAGGRPVAVNDLVHPDNAQLAVLAADALRLDIAGIDLLIEDITRSWHEIGAAICEVNGQPQLGATTGPHLYSQILMQRLGPEIRIPVVVVMDANPQGQLARAVAAQLTLAGYNTGCVNRQGTFLGQEQLLAASASAFAGGRMLLTHSKLDALVYNLYNHDALRAGLPFDRYDWLIIGKQLTYGSDQLVHPSSSADTARLLTSLLPYILPACVEQVLQLSEESVLDKRYIPSALRCEVTDWDGVVEQMRLRWFFHKPGS
jgi:cyanophycin synthetase